MDFLSYKYSLGHCPGVLLDDFDVLSLPFLP